MKRFLKLTLALTFLILSLSFAIFATDTAEPITGTAGESITWTLDDKGVLTFTGTGDMPNYNWYDNKSPWYVHRLSVNTVVVSEGITSVGSCAFKDATSLVTVTLPEGIKTIGKEAFYGCTALKTFICPEGLESIGSGTFRNCTALTDMILSSTLVTIGDNAFNGCEKMKDVVLPDTLTEIGEYSFFGCRALFKITYPQTLKRISKYAFANCTNLRFITFTTGLMYIDESAFFNCAYIGTLVFPESLENIGKNAFSNCIDMTRMTLPESLITIGSGAFYGCTALKNITYNGSKEQWADIRKGINNAPLSTATISYKGDSIPKILGYGECGENVIWEFNNRYTLIISGTGEMENYKLNGPNSPWYAVREYIRTVVVSEGVTSIGDFAFRDCTELKTVTIPDSVTKMGDYAFSNCRKLVSLTLPNELETIGKNAFRDCAVLEALVFPETLTSIGENAFYKCRALKEMVIPNSVTSMGQDTFIYCSNLEKVTLSKSMEIVRTGTFKETALRELRVPSSIRTFSDGAFSGCTAELEVYTLYSEEEWNNLRIGTDNDALVNAKMNYKKAAEDITVTLDGNVVDCETYGQRACIVDGRTLVPLRAIFESLTATVEWDGNTYTVTSTLGETTIKLTIGDINLYKNDEPIVLDVPAMLINDRTMVPARAIAEAYGVNVDWDEYTRTVILVNPTAE